MEAKLFPVDTPDEEGPKATLEAMIRQYCQRKGIKRELRIEELLEMRIAAGVFDTQGGNRADVQPRELRDTL